MTKEETKEAIRIMQAYVEGKTIEVTYKGKSDWVFSNNPCWDFDTNDYRVKPEPHYRPFESAKEVMEAIKEKGQYLLHKCPKGYYHISAVYPERPDLENSPLRIRINGKVHTAEDMMVYYEWADGTPFGKLVE